jgi:hypothetical protein
MLPTEAQSKLQDALLKVNWLNLTSVMNSLALGYAWGRYDNMYFRPNFKQAEEDLPWLLDNVVEICEAIEVLKDSRPGRSKS